MNPNTSNVLRKIVGGCFLAMMIAVGVGPVFGQAASGAPTVISIIIGNENGGPVFTERAVGLPLNFSASITRPLGSSVLIDIYFGVIVPSGQIVSWVPKIGGGSVLVAGLSPVARGLPPGSYDTSTLFGKEVQYIFSGDETPGLYSILALVVVQGRDPFDSRQWISANMLPLIFLGK